MPTEPGGEYWLPGIWTGPVAMESGLGGAIGATTV